MYRAGYSFFAGGFFSPQEFRLGRVWPHGLIIVGDVRCPNVRFAQFAVGADGAGVSGDVRGPFAQGLR